MMLQIFGREKNLRTLIAAKRFLFPVGNSVMSYEFFDMIKIGYITNWTLILIFRSMNNPHVFMLLGSKTLLTYFALHW